MIDMLHCFQFFIEETINQANEKNIVGESIIKSLFLFLVNTVFITLQNILYHIFQTRPTLLHV